MTHIQKAFISDAAFTIDDHGYAAVVLAVRILLGLPDMDRFFDALGVAVKALEEIAALERESDPGWPYDFSITEAIDLAKQALAQIADGEAGHDTPSDS